MEKKLYRDQYNKVIGGVCAGLADYLGMDVTVLRLIFAFAFFVMGIGFPTYIILWIVLPKKQFNPFTTPADPATVNYIVPPIVPAEPFVPTQTKRSNGGAITGSVLIILGTAFLLHQFHFIRFWELTHFGFPVIIVAVGIALIVSGQQSKPWDSSNWHQPQAGTDADTLKKDEPFKTTDPSNDNNTTVQS